MSDPNNRYLKFSLVVIALVVALVYLGRPIQETIAPIMERIPQTSSLLIVPIILGAIWCAYTYYQEVVRLHSLQVAVVHALVLLPLLCFIQLRFVDPIEYTHLLLYGSLAWTLTKAKGPVAAFILANLVSVLDELLQWFHPRRVFDTNDLLLNFASILSGLLLVLFISKQAKGRKLSQLT